jgi:3',5'-cyclic AMP phosphodiesterase CpdA
VNEDENFSASPYPANAEANRRARYVFAQINRINPRLVLHLGDMINPVPELPSFAASAANFNAIAADLTMPIHLMPGNHDIGDKPVSWMPAGRIISGFSDQYRKTFGKAYFAVEEEGCHFVMLNSPLVNSGLPEEAEQADWFEGYLKANKGGADIRIHPLSALYQHP